MRRCSGRQLSCAYGLGRSTDEGTRRRLESPGRWQAGFTLVEMLMAIAVASILLALGYNGYRQFNESITVRKAAKTLASDLALTRSFAIQRRANVSLVIDETNRTYIIRASDGTALVGRSFNAGSGLALERMVLDVAGDSITFNSRGLLVGASSVQVGVGRGERTQRISVNALGRYTIHRES